jgi:hypothetical protein
MYQEIGVVVIFVVLFVERERGGGKRVDGRKSGGKVGTRKRYDVYYFMQK